MFYQDYNISCNILKRLIEDYLSQQNYQKQQQHWKHFYKLHFLQGEDIFEDKISNVLKNKNINVFCIIFNTFANL